MKLRHRLLPVVLLAAFFQPVLLQVPIQAQNVNVPPIKFTTRTLANGLKVYAIEDHASPTVSVQMWYHVGSKDDPQGRSGFAHLFEHIMFKSTKNMKSEMMDRLTEDVGGLNNASTADDVTNYFEVIPSNYLETLLWAEADRLSTLVVDEASFKSERDVVKEEYRQRYLANPYGKLYLAIEQQSFTAHPYKRPGIGNIDELNAATIEDVRSFHATYYRPDNVALIVAGDFVPAQLDAWVDKYFGRIAKPATPLPRVSVKEPARTAERKLTEYAANVPLPAVVFTYLAPAAASEDAAPLKVAAAVLSEGESSRLYRALVYEQQIAQSAEAEADLREDLGLIVVRGILASGKKLENMESSLLTEIKRLQDAPPSASELARAKNQIVTKELSQRETNLGKALALGSAAIVRGDANRVNTEIDQLQAVTAADVQRVMRKYLTPTNRVVINYLPEAGKGNDSAAPQKGGN